MVENNEWVEIQVEPTRYVMFKSNPGVYQVFHNVTHFKKRSHGWTIKCKEGVVYCENDDISHIISHCEDWLV